MTSPNCDCAYSLMPTVAASPSRLTHSWLWLNRIALRSGMASPFVSLRTRPLVKRQRDDLGGRHRPTDVDTEPRSDGCESRRQVGHRDVVAEGEGDVARGHHPHPLRAVHDRVAVAGNTPVEHAKAGQDPGETLLAGAENRVPADEVIVQAECPIESRLERIGVGIHVIAIEPESRFEAQGVASAQPGRSNPVAAAFLEQGPPEPGGVAIGAEDFEAVLAGVAGARNDGGNAGDLALDKGVIAQRTQVLVGKALDEGDRMGSLDAEQRPVPADVEDELPRPPTPTLPHKGGGSTRPNPVEVAVLVAGVDHQEMAAIGHRVDEDVIDDATPLVAEHGVLGVTRAQLCQVPADHPLRQA